MNPARWTDDDVCIGCRQHASRHEVDPMTGRLKCPVLREQKVAPAQEPYQSPRGDY